MVKIFIDFEKAFDSLSWTFLYRVLDYFGYSADFIKWVKLFNTDITAYVYSVVFYLKKFQLIEVAGKGTQFQPIYFY